MLDRRSEDLLRQINKECQEGSYKILEISDLIYSMPKKYKADYESINHLMGYLSAGEYISVKYYDDQVYCVCPLPRGRRLFEEEQYLKKINRKRKKLYFWLAVLLFIITFSSSMLAQYLIKHFL